MISIPAEALRRQRLIAPCGPEDYDALFRAASPVPTPTWSAPGSPPALPQHADFDDAARNDRMRGARILMKGRFAMGLIGYVFADEMEWFAGAFRKNPPRMSVAQELIYDTLDREGPLSIGLLKEITRLKVKEIAPALAALQCAFLVFEDQVDSDMERSFYIMRKELPDIDPQRFTRQEALEFLIPRWIRLCFEADAAMLHALTGLPARETGEALASLCEQGVLTARGDRYRCAGDDGLGGDPVPGTRVLCPSDFLIRVHRHRVAQAYGGGLLRVLLIDGALAGAVRGRFRFGPHDVEDIVVEEPYACRRDEILDRVAKVFPGSALRRYNGVSL